MRCESRSAALVAALLLSCARTARAPTPKGAVAAPPEPADAGIDVAIVDPLPPLDALAAQGSADMGSMREALRVSDATRPASVTADADACFRAVFAASGPARAWFEDTAGAPRGAEAKGTNGLVPPGGPACARKGEALRLVVSGPDVTARAVIWQR